MDGKIVTVRFAPLPPKTRFVTATRLVFDEPADTIRFVAAVSLSPIVNGMVIGVSSFVTRLVIAEMVGGELTALTVTKNEVFAFVEPSLTKIVMIALPDWLMAGERVTVRLPPALLSPVILQTPD